MAAAAQVPHLCETRVKAERTHDQLRILLAQQLVCHVAMPSLSRAPVLSNLLATGNLNPPFLPGPQPSLLASSGFHDGGWMHRTWGGLCASFHATHVLMNSASTCCSESSQTVPNAVLCRPSCRRQHLNWHMHESAQQCDYKSHRHCCALQHALVMPAPTSHRHAAGSSPLRVSHNCTRVAANHPELDAFVNRTMHTFLTCLHKVVVLFALGA